MKPEYDQQLVERYPMLYAQRGRSMMETCMCWGFECGDGWYDIIDHLSAELETMNKEIAERKKNDGRWLMGYSLVSFFSLGFTLVYGINLEITGNGHSPFLAGCMAIAGLLALLNILQIRGRSYVLTEATQVKEKFGTLRFYADYGEDYEDEIEDLIHQAEVRSSKTCEECGQPGVTRPGGWIKTLCDDCVGKR